jgi:hypothetical protein
MATLLEEYGEFDDLEARLRTILPEGYQNRYEDIQPVSMGSASLKYGLDGRVAWDQIWGSFCDLAMAGGPPHKGTLLEPGREEEIETQADRYREVVQEICRGITMVTGLCAEPSPVSGWVRMYCTSAAMAGWLARAIAMENTSRAWHSISLPDLRTELRKRSRTSSPLSQRPVITGSNIRRQPGTRPLPIYLEQWRWNRHCCSRRSSITISGWTSVQCSLAR